MAFSRFVAVVCAVEEEGGNRPVSEHVGVRLKHFLIER
jgi:hypothetical protein